MPSLMWGRDPADAYGTPYEYDVNDQFKREAAALLRRFYRLLAADRHVHADGSVETAVFLLQMDALDSLQDALAALNEGRHRVAFKLVRNVVESLDLAAYFWARTPRSAKDLESWYRDEIVSNRVYRNHIGKTDGKDAEARKNAQYRELSRFVHRTFRSLLLSYSRGGDGQLVHDAYMQVHGDFEGSDRGLVLPHTVAAGYALLSHFIILLGEELHRRGAVAEDKVRTAFAEALETETVPISAYYLDG